MTRSATRIEVDEHVRQFVEIVAKEKPDRKGKLAYIGVAGDPTPKGEYHSLFPLYETISFDADPQWGADITMDITQPTEEHQGQYDLLLMNQVIEHIPNLWDVPYGIKDILKEDGIAMIDCPWDYPYHAEPPSFGDYWRITKDGFRVLFHQFFDILNIIEGKHNTSCIVRLKSTS